MFVCVLCFFETPVLKISGSVRKPLSTVGGGCLGQRLCHQKGGSGLEDICWQSGGGVPFWGNFGDIIC